MCGICGIAHPDPSHPVDCSALIRMRDALAHRGPDGEGLHVQDGVALGHRRLSIIDVAGGAQPISNEDGTVWVTFNGEIYNFRDLAERLMYAGHSFRTHCDTEVLVHAYEEWGDDFVGRLNGMFAFALHDTRRSRVLLARDHLGIKPLFLRVERGSLYFASEIKGILAAGSSPAHLRPESLREYLIFRYVAGRNTFFDGVERLEPGHLAIWEDGRLATRPFWTPPAGDGRSIPLDAAASELDELLSRAVSAQLMSDVPLGTFCSGGVDSGLVSAYAARASAHTLQTFAVGFADPRWDERVLAADTATRIRSDHHTVMAHPEEFLALIPRLQHFQDEPLSHPNSIPLFELSRFARQFVTVVLTGEGSDELFCGYPRYHIARWRALLEAVPGPVRRALGVAVGLAPGHRAAKLSDGLGQNMDDAILLNSAYVSPDLVAGLTGHAVSDALAERRRLLERARSDRGAVATLSRYELLTYLGCALDRMDRMSMAASLEGRVPFLDVPLVEWGLGIAGRLKLAGKANKRVVKHLANRYLNPAIARGAKSGFGVPLDEWFRTPVFGPMLSRMRDPSHPAATLFDRRQLDRLISEHSAAAADHGEVLWLTANVFVWAENYLT